MTEPENDTAGLSVASRIRMYQSNFKNGANVKPILKESSVDSPRLQSKTKDNCRNDETRKETESVSEKKEPISQREIKLENNLQKLNSPIPSPRPSPVAKHKPIKCENSDTGAKELILNKSVPDQESTSQVSKAKASVPKPPLPSKPSYKVNDCDAKDVNDNCNAKPALPEKRTSSEFVKSPLIAEFSSEKLAEKSRKHSAEGSSWKRNSGPPSRPLPPGPKPQPCLLVANKKDSDFTSVSPKPITGRIQECYEDVDGVYEDPNDQGVCDAEDDCDYEDPDSSLSSTDFKDSTKLAKKDRKMLSRISTSRRPPPLPVPNQDVQRKLVKPPPLPSRNAVQTAEDQSIYSYASDSVENFAVKPPVFQPNKEDSTYETPDASTVRGLMLGLQNNSGNYETPDSDSVKEFLLNVNASTDDMYETPNQNAVSQFAEALIAKQHTADSDSDSDAYCDPDGIQPPFQQQNQSHVPLAPQKNLPPPPPGEGRNDLDSSDDDYEDPLEEHCPAARILSLRRGSQPVFNPEAYLALVDINADTTYQDPAVAFASSNEHLNIDELSDNDDEYEDLADEPLYQVYAADVLSEMRRQSQKGYQEDDVFNEYSTGSIEAGQRLLWCQLPSVRDSGVLNELEPRERKRQEAMFEVITSEASYLKSLSILVNHFMNAFSDEPSKPADIRIIDKQQFHFIFGGLGVIKNTSEKFLHSLRGKQQENYIISSISDILKEYATNHFECYVKYCSNQVYQERTLSALVSENQGFCDVLGKLESSTRSQGLSLQSFLMLPMQRITRLPLLMDAICHQCEPGSEEFHKTDKALSEIHKVVKACNEGARKMERIEEMYFIQQMLTFKTKPIPIVSSSRWLLRRGELACLEGEKRIRAFKSLLRGGKYYRIYLFLFNDLLLVTKMKGEDSFKVVDHCSRALLRIDDENISTGDTLKQGSVGIPTNKYMFSLILLENYQKKTVSYICLAENETEKIRWIDAINPKPGGEQDGEKIYEEWDCPQVRAIHAYQAEQPDELNLREGDVIKVLRKLPDGWYEGMHLIDGEQGWFPANHTEEIHSEHTKARNLMQRYRLINTVTMALDSRMKRL